MPTYQKILFPFLLVFFEMATYLSNDMYLPALPAMMHELSLSYHQAQMALTTWFFGSISAQLVLGPLSDRYGRKIILCSGAILFTASTLLCALASDLHILLIGRFIQGSGLCFIAVPGYASIHETFEQKQAIRILALMSSIAVLAPAFGPLLGSIVLLLLDWRWIFGFLVIWASIATVLLFIWMPETLPLENRHSLEIRPMLQRYKNILINKQFLITMTLFGLLFCAFICWIATGPFLVIDQFKYNPLMFGIFQALIFFAYIAANHLLKYVMDWLGVEKMIRLGLFIALLGAGLSVLTAIVFPSNLPAMIVTLMLFSFGTGFAFAPLNRLSIDSSEESMGARLAIQSLFISGSATLATVLVNIFYDGSLLSLGLLIFVMMGLAVVLNKIRYSIIIPTKAKS